MENANVIDEASESSCITWQFFQELRKKPIIYWKIITQCMNRSTSCQSFQEVCSEIHGLANKKVGSHMY